VSAADYHRAELEIARNPGDPRWNQPSIPADCHDILDIGCGAGQTLIAAERPAGDRLCGVDLDGAALRLGRELSDRVELLQAAGERLPFADGSFDMVCSRVALPYMDVPVALAEIGRILRPGGTAWFALHSLRRTRRQLWRALRSLDVGGALSGLYVLGNGAWVGLGGRSLRSPLPPHGHESFQTSRGITRLLRRAGFVDVALDRGRFFNVTARRSPARS
jgi:SAM-dependent methyltransferase